MNIRNVVISGLAIFLLVIYALVIYTSLSAYNDLGCTVAVANTDACQEKADHIISEQSGFLFMMIAGLVSSVITAALTVVPAKDAGVFGKMVANTGQPNRLSRAVNWVSSLYVVVWAIFGGWCLLETTLWMEKGQPVLTEMYEYGKVWLGIALGAVAMFLSVDPNKIRGLGG